MTIGRPGRTMFFLGGLLVGVLTGCFLGSFVIQHQGQLQTTLLRSRVLNHVLEKKAYNDEKQHLRIPAQTASSQSRFRSTPISTVAQNQYRIRANNNGNALKSTSLVAIIVLNCQSHLLKGVEETWARASDTTVLAIAPPLHCRSTLESSVNLKFIEIPHLNNSNEEFYYAVLDFLYKNKFDLHDWFIVTPVNVYINSENVNRLTAGLDQTHEHYIALNSSLLFDTTPLLLSQKTLKEIVKFRKQCQILCNHDESSFSLSMCSEARQCVRIRVTELYKPTALKLVQSGNNLWINGEQLSDTVMAQPITASNNVYSIHLFFKIIKYRKLKTKVLQLSNIAAQLLDHISQHDTTEPTLVTNFHSTNQAHFTASEAADICSWAYFNNQSMWYSDQRTYPRSIMSVYTFQQQEVEMALLETVRAANAITGNQLVLRAFTNGYICHDALNGNEYIIDGIFSKFGLFQQVFEKQIHLSRPFNAHTTEQITLLSNAENVHFVVPISSGIQRLELFLQNYEEEFLAKNENTSLTLAVYGNATIAYVKGMVWKMLRKYPIAADITIITGKGTFSRGRALHAAINHLRPDDLVFICDMDLILDTDFISRCRSNTEKGKRVYYPEFFKLYNDKYMFRTSAGNGARSSINRQNGHWAYYSYGMVCIYKSDYDAVSGFDQSLEGWGGEDVQLVDKLLSHRLDVFRAPDTGLMHRWHNKECKITDNQYKECLWSKSENLADKLDLARLAFCIEETINC